MEKLSFYGVEGALVSSPYGISGDPISVAGQPKSYVGYRYDQSTHKFVLSADPDSFNDDGSPAIAKLVREVKRDPSCLRAADSYTAGRCGMPFSEPKKAVSPHVKASVKASSAPPVAVTPDDSKGAS